MPIVPTASGVTAASAVPSTSGKLHLAFEGESWTKITDSTGQVLSSQLNLAGSELNLAGVAPYELIIGNAKAVRLYRRGKSVDLTSHINPSNEVARLTLE
jgi:cytoskeleton protein RodZ